ncbi:glycoside hydrolase family 1 protein [Pseudoxanthomonas suwonensis]|uniref:glycoside hydrolase family 1 protein n=1 Tax=Pseudoxanthomonas suwonensis TaxID=314722 RepID=UPI0009E4AF07|nr:family 1 glycosylhydrolase [Pseudoxanthomonas suwonensis]
MRYERREALKRIGAGLAGGVLVAGGIAGARAAGRPPSVPGRGQGFLWGVAGAAYQTEGGNVASDLWVMEHTKPSIFKDPSGDAVDSYHRVFDDIALTASLGFNTYRFSIEWSRIEPERGQVSRAALAYYRRVLEAIRAHGMLPMVTFVHFTSPRWFAAAGGFETREGIAPYVDYCRLLTRELGDLIGMATTFNEPNLGALLAWSPAIRPLRPLIAGARQLAAKAIGAEQFAPPMLGSAQVQQPIMIEAHDEACAAVRAESGGRIPIGVTLALNEERGDPRNIARKHSTAMLPWLQADGDWVGVQNYTWTEVGEDTDLPLPADVEMTQMGYPYAPESLAAVVRTVAAHWNKPIYVTENGVSSEDDSRRVAFIDRALEGLAGCLRDGIDLRGYVHWSLLDNWEWVHGFGPRFGLVAVDRSTFARTPKPSAAHLGRIARAGWAARGIAR